MTGMTSHAGAATDGLVGLGDIDGVALNRARQAFARLMAHVSGLYCMGGSSSVSAREAHALATSVAYVLGIADATPEQAARVLCAGDPIAAWHDGLAALDRRMDDALEVWREIVATMPPLRNVALRDTLASLGELRRRYDTRFAAHVVPCDIDYPLSRPPDTDLMGMDYIEAWLAQLLHETRWLARFDARSMRTVLERACPDHRGLHVNLYDLLLPHERELSAVGGS